MSASDTDGLVWVEGEVDKRMAAELGEAVEGLVDKGVQLIVIDCSNVTFMDSSGLKVIMEAHERMVARNGALTIRQPGDMLARLMTLTGLDEALRGT